MAFEDGLAERIADAILVDEVGIETGRHGPFFLKTVYRPIFHNTDAGLLPCGVEGKTGPLCDGQPVTMRAFLADVAPEERLFVECLCRMLHLRNYRNIGVDGLVLFLGPHPHFYRNAQTALGQIGVMAEYLEKMEVDPALVVCEVGEGVDGGVLNALSTKLRGCGMRIAVDDFGVGQSTLSLVRTLDPDTVKLNGVWFRRIADVAVAVRLLVSLVGTLQREGRQVLIEGIQTPAHLRVAMETGADFLQGDLLRPPAFAGALFDTAPVNVNDLFAQGAKVVPLFANRNRPA